MEGPQIKETYEPEHPLSVFVMFTRKFELVWAYSGNELRRVYLERPEDFISEPLELPISADLDRQLTNFYDRY